MAQITIDGHSLEAEEGAPLVEVIKRNGIYVSNLCYIDGLPPYAGCRTCLVEIEGARGLQLSCTSTVRDGMVVGANTPAVKKARQYVLSIINANHSDRCLTCHRRVKCMPGDICLRDDVVTHRCLTCSKNYRCELQTTNDILDMGEDNIEPWEGEERTYYQAPPPEPDRANPWVEFDPQMCIICTRCVRACDDLRHTGAITLAGRGYTTRIAFGSGGPIHDSNCDFCGACIDVCPTATLMEKPNKWLARTEDWVSTVCNSCSVGCTISMGHRDGKPVIVKPDLLNPFSADQICVRGRFHYDAVRNRDRLSQHMVRKGGALAAASWEEALDDAADRIAAVHKEHGAGAIGFLGAPFATNEELFLLQRIAREVAGSPHIDTTAGPVNRAVTKTVAGAFGTERLPADLTNIPTKAKTILVVADDLEEANNVASVRIKDAIDPRKLPRREPAKLIVIANRWGELCDFAEPHGGVWLQPEPGREPAALGALATLLAADEGIAKVAEEAGLDLATARAPSSSAHRVDDERLQRAVSILREAALDPEHEIAVVFAPRGSGAALAAETAKAVCNVALLLRGRDAARCTYVLPTEANVNGARDVGAAPDVGSGRVPVDTVGMGVDEMLDAAREAKLKALVVAGDNPIMFRPATARVREALQKLDALIVIDTLMTDTAQLAHTILADVPTYGKDGTFTSADFRVQRRRAAQSAPGDARPAWQSLAGLGSRLAERLGSSTRFEYAEAADVTEEITSTVPGYEPFHFYGYLGWGKGRAIDDAPPERVTLQAVASEPAAARNGNGEVTLLTGRTLYTSLEGAAIHSPEADKLHREDAVFINQYDAHDLGIAIGDTVTLRNGNAELSLPATLTTSLPRGAVFVSSYYDGGAVNALLPPENGAIAQPHVSLVAAKAAVS
jgi:predicted molibdopterin-dependent oxidoreductase YjgC